MEKFLEIHLEIQWAKQGWRAELFDSTQTEFIGFIDGSIDRDKDDKRKFVVMQSDLKEEYQGKGFGLLMYEMAIRRCMQFADKFESSDNLNDKSVGVWKALMKKYYNVSKEGKHYVVVKPDRELLHA